MAGLKIEGDTTNISDKQLDFIKSVIEKKGFKNAKVFIELVGKSGDNFMADVKRINIDDGEGHFLKMIAKVAPQNMMQRSMSGTEYVFRNEHIMYTKVLPKFTQLEKLYDVPVADRLVYPICYGSTADVPSEIVILEDMNETNFKMLSKFEPLNNDCIKSVLRNIALFHSLGFALKYKEPERFDEYKKELFNLLIDTDFMEETVVIVSIMEGNIVNLLKTDYHKKTIQEVLINTFKNFSTISKSAEDSKHSTIQHGDAWTNNFMFKFDGDQLSESILIDYQVCKIASPVSDILFMLSACTDYASRKENFHDWIDYYHIELDKALTNYGLKSNYVYSKDQLDDDLKRYGKFVFGHTIYMLGMFISMKSDEAALVKEAMQKADISEFANKTGAANSTDPETVASFRTKVEGLIDSYHEFGLL